MELTREQQERYVRQIAVGEINVQGQEKLLHSKVLVVGAGGLGSPAAMYLAGSGVGTIGIADPDKVDLSNLQRQILHGMGDLGKDKVQSAQEAIRWINPDTQVRAYPVAVGADNVMELISDYDIVIDASYNFSTKFLINDACVLAGKPFVHAGVIRFQGQLMTYVPGQGPCYRCIFRTQPKDGTVPTGKQAGVLGMVCGVIGSLQAMEAVKYLTGVGELLTGRLLTCNMFTMNFRTVNLPKRTAECAVCGDHPVITKPGSV